MINVSLSEVGAGKRKGEVMLLSLIDDCRCFVFVCLSFSYHGKEDKRTSDPVGDIKILSARTLQDHLAENEFQSSGSEREQYSLKRTVDLDLKPPR